MSHVALMFAFPCIALVVISSFLVYTRSHVSCGSWSLFEDLRRKPCSIHWFIMFVHVRIALKGGAYLIFRHTGWNNQWLFQGHQLEVPTRDKAHVRAYPSGLCRYGPKYGTEPQFYRYMSGTWMGHFYGCHWSIIMTFSHLWVILYIHIYYR